MTNDFDEKEKEEIEKEKEKETEEALEEGEDVESDEESEDEKSEPYGMMSRIIGVFIEPDKAFKHIGEKPEIWGPVIFCFVVLLVASLFTMNEMADLTTNFYGELFAEQGMDASEIEVASHYAGVATRFISIMTTLQMVFIWLIFALIAYIVGLFLGQDSNFKSSLAVIGYSSLPAILIKQGIIATAMFMSGSWTSLAEYQQAVMMKGSFSLHTLFGNPDMNVYLQSLLLSIEPFLFWGLFLMAVGFKYANKVKSDQGWKIAIVLTILTVAAFIPLLAAGLKQLAETT